MRANLDLPPERLPGVDAVRGLAMVWMTVFHFCFDLSSLGLWKQNFYDDPLWTMQRTCIVSLFLFCAGWGQAIAVSQGQDWRRFWKRWAQVALCAALVTLGSRVMFPNSFIYFGVLHGMAVMLLVLRWVAPWSLRHLLALCLLGVALVCAKWLAEVGLSGAWADVLNQRSLNWLGLITRKPITEDYVPLVPWLGVMLWGFVAGTTLLRCSPHALRQATLPGAATLARLGRHSLSYYMLHQPVLLGLLNGWLWLHR